MSHHSDDDKFNQLAQFDEDQDVNQESCYTGKLIIGIYRRFDRWFPIVLSDPINLSGGCFWFNSDEFIGVETAT